MKCLIIIPAFNEEENIEAVVRDIQGKCPFAECLVVDDCSNDGTRGKLAGLGVDYVSGSINLGIGGAVQLGYKYALRNNFDMAVQVDGDGQHDASYVPDMVDRIVSGQADIVIGSRFLEKEGFQSSFSRRIGITFLSGWIYVMCGRRVKDVTSGFRAVNRRFIKIYANDYPDDYPEPEAIVMAVLYGGEIEEIPVVMRERAAGTSSINMKKSVYYMIKVTLAIFVRRLSLGIRRG